MFTYEEIVWRTRWANILLKRAAKSKTPTKWMRAYHDFTKETAAGIPWED